MSESQRAEDNREAAILNGICSKCLKRDAAKDRKLCKACLSLTKERAKARRDLFVFNGLCARCGYRPPREGRTECGICAKRASSKDKRYYRRRVNG